MSFDDYANHIYQKHRLAVALALIKSKPANVKTEKYLEDLKSKIDHKMDDDDITICSDDFLFDDDDDEMNDSVTILKDFNPEFVINDENWAGDNATSEKPSIRPEILNRNIPENLSQITYYENSPLTDVILPQAHQNFNQKSDIELSIPENVVNKDFSDRTSNIDYNSEIADKSTQKTYSKENNSETANLNHKTLAITSNESMNVTYYDSRKPVPYTVHGFTQNYTHYSASQTDIVIPNNYLYGVNNNKNASNVQNKAVCEENPTTVVNIDDFENETQFVSIGNSSNNKTDKNLKNREEFEYTQTMNMFSQRNDDNFDEIQNINAHLDSESHETMDDLNNILDKDTESNANQNSTQYSQNVDKYFNEVQVIEENHTRNRLPTGNDMNKTGHHTEVEVIETTYESFMYAHQNIDYVSQNQEFSHSKNVSEKATDIPTVNDHNQFTNTECNTENHSQNSEKDSQLATLPADSSDHRNRREEHRITEEEYESEEIISYKVLEEFNKVKSFLNRQNRRMSCDGYSTDSGYRSDSQRSNNRSGKYNITGQRKLSKKKGGYLKNQELVTLAIHCLNGVDTFLLIQFTLALQLSGNWLNQSGCCLFNYIMQCPLVAGTRDITNEIAQVLSQLVDRLHEEEKYPSFLEDLLETIDLLLRQVYQRESGEDSEFLKKDEHIQRILLLNKSIHIQKHSIEKMSNILETFHTKVTQTDSTFELSNIDEIENITYIFHLLEILLKKYLKNREISSQSSTQNSQEDEKVFKRSSITDIWRKKWNPSQTVFEGSREKKCVLKNCSEILNRIIVDCVSSYSLVAYSALKCFNSMQT